MSFSILEEILIFLGITVVVVSAFRRFHLPPILAYLFIGVLFGPYGLGVISDSEDARFLAEFGVVFLLFTVGLEFSLSQLIAMKREVLGLGGAQVVVTALIAGIIALLAGMSAESAFVIGGVMAMSSTAIVTRQLAVNLEIGSRHGRLSVGMLLFQDAAVIPFLIMIPAMTGNDTSSVSEQLAWTLIKGVIIVMLMLAAGRWLLRPLFREIASSRSAELFTLTALFITLLAAWTTHYSGLSLALGAFMAGMMLGETEFRHQLETDIRPFRDVLLGLFFITIGMLLDVKSLLDIGHWVVALAIALIVLKMLVIMLLSILLGENKGVAMRTAIVLAHGGEFSLALLALAASASIFTAQVTQVLLATLIISMALAPIMIHYNGRIVKRLYGESYLRHREQFVNEVEKHATGLSDHIIICGYGRIGQNIARFLDKEQLEYLALDLDPVRVSNARAAGERVNYGDATHLKMLEAAGLERAKILVISFNDIYAALKILPQVRQYRPEIPILVRVRSDSYLERLQKAGATEVIPETLEASVMLATHVLFLMDVPVSNIVKHIQDVHDHRFKMLREVFHGQDLKPLEENMANRKRLRTVILDASSFAVGKKLEELNLDKLNVNVNAVVRENYSKQIPEPDMILQADDTLLLYGTSDNLHTVEIWLKKGHRP